jgi:1-aminocyclopropane-1-carboxylate deaminase/D-cysteine desulfhydrase-like pyridoxal-dependent ACC family enzyme
MRLTTRVIAVSADDPAGQIAASVRSIIRGIDDLGDFDAEFEIDDSQVGDGYGLPTDASREAQTTAARREGIFVDHTYTAKAMAALIAYVRAERFSSDETVLFWHTGGQVGLFA